MRSQVCVHEHSEPRTGTMTKLWQTLHTVHAGGEGCTLQQQSGEVEAVLRLLHSVSVRAQCVKSIVRNRCILADEERSLGKTRVNAVLEVAERTIDINALKNQLSLVYKLIKTEQNLHWHYAHYSVSAYRAFLRPRGNNQRWKRGRVKKGRVELGRESLVKWNLVTDASEGGAALQGEGEGLMLCVCVCVCVVAR